MASSPRFSLGWSLCVIAFVAFCCGGLSYPSPIWSGLFHTINIAAFLGSIVVIVYGRGATAAFAGGFAIFSGSILTLLMAPWLRDEISLGKLARGLWPRDQGMGWDWHAIQRQEITNYIVALVLAYTGGILAQRLYVAKVEHSKNCDEATSDGGNAE